MSKAESSEFVDLIARVYKLEQNMKMAQQFFGEFIASHNRLVEGCEALETLVRDHIGSATVDEKPRIIVPSGEG